MATAAHAILERALDQGQGVLRLRPAWVPRSFCIPAKRLRLHTDDYYAFGVHRGGIDERWFASTTRADNGPLTTADEGLSWIDFVHAADAGRVLLKDAIETAGAEILGAEAMRRHGGWTMYAKFFDNLEPLPFHLHPNDAVAARVGRKGKPESYYFPPQLNTHGGLFPHTYFGLHPGVTRDQVRACLAGWDAGDNGVLHLSKAYKLKLGTGWDVPAGVLHAPGSLCTYEPQRASDVFAMFQNLTWDKYVPRALLVKDVPDSERDNLDYLVDMIDWELNTDPAFFERRYAPAKPVAELSAMRAEGYEERWIAYGCADYSAKELTVLPGRSAAIRDAGAYGAIVIQGRGRFGPHAAEAANLIRFGAMTADEFFVTAAAGTAGPLIVNDSAHEPLVMLKHFGPA